MSEQIPSIPDRDALPELVPAYEKTRRERTAIDALVGSLEGMLERLFRPIYQRRIKGLLVRAEAIRADYGSLGDDELRTRTREAGGMLRRNGLSDDATMSRFLALLSEVSTRTLGLTPHPVQLEGVRVLLDGKLLEMATGEGKTLVAGLAAAAAALCGMPVHVVTVNDYLAARDADYIKPAMDFLKLSLGVVVKESSLAQRIEAYACPVCYCTNNELAFDYLKDSLQSQAQGRLSERVFSRYYQKSARRIKSLEFAIVDEADSVMVDEARTPLILSEGIDRGIDDEVIERVMVYTQQLEPGDDFIVDHLRWSVALTDACQQKIESDFAQVTDGPLLLRVLRQELIIQALCAHYLYKPNEHYLVRDEKVEIIDEYTGRVMPDRVWSAGLHQMIEYKEHCPLTEPRLTVARITYQRFFRRYRNLAGMSGTVAEVSNEFWNVYGLAVYKVPTHKPCVRKIRPSQVFQSKTQKWQHLVRRVKDIHSSGAPILIGVRSVAAVEEVCESLSSAGLLFETLHAANDRYEAETVSKAGQRGKITIATNMAGRGTDIALGPGVDALGGLHVIMTERHDSGRIDRQLKGRCARQGNPGSFEIYQSLEDPLAQIIKPRFLLNIARLGLSKNASRFASYLLAKAQLKLERQHSKTRESLLKSDHSEGDLLAFSGEPE